MGNTYEKDQPLDFFEQLGELAEELHRKFNSWTQVNLVFGLKSNYKMKYAQRTRCVITPAFLEGLQACGYTVQIVPYTEEPKRPEPKKNVKEMSIYEIVKAAEEEGIDYGEYVKRHDPAN